MRWLSIAGAVGVIATAQYKVGSQLAIPLGLVLAVTGLLPVPSMFPVLYRVYTSDTIGYRLRHKLHKRDDPHTTVANAWRRLTAARPDTVDHDDPATVSILPVPVLSDNYAYLVICERSGNVAAVDPADPHRILHLVDALNEAAVRQEAAPSSRPFFRLTHILTSHKHWDHAGGNRELVCELAKRQGSGDGTVEVIGSAIDRPMSTTTFVHDGDVTQISPYCHAKVIHTPGHTQGSIMFLVSAEAAAPKAPQNAALFDTKRRRDAILEVVTHRPELRGPKHAHQSQTQFVAALGGLDRLPGASVDSPALLTGDCLFCGGCGTQFEAKGASDCLRTYDALRSLADAAPKLPVFVGHEYSMRLLGEWNEHWAKRVLELSAKAGSLDAGGAAATTSAGASTTTGTSSFSERIQGSFGAFSDRVRSRFLDVQTLSRQGLASVPSSMALELSTNPFLTLDRDVLLEMANRRAAASEAESAIYLSPRRTGCQDGVNVETQLKAQRSRL